MQSAEIVQKWMLLTNGVAAIVGNDFVMPSGDNVHIEATILDGVPILMVNENFISLNEHLLDHLVLTSAVVFLYRNINREYLHRYEGMLTLDRDQLLMVKGGIKFT